MNTELLSYINSVLGTACAILVIPPLLKKGTRHWVLLVAIFLLVMGLQYAGQSARHDQETALLRSAGMASFVMLFGWVMSVVFRKREETLRREAGTNGQSG